MPVDDFHAIVPDGDVELILPHSEQLGTPVDDVFEDMHGPSRVYSNPWYLDDQLGEPPSMEMIRDIEEWAPRSPVYEKSGQDAKMEKASTATEMNENLSETSSEKCMRIRVSSKQLALASTCLRKT